MRAGAKVINVNSQNKTTEKYYLKDIDGVVVCLSFYCQYREVWHYKRRRIYLVFFFYLHNEMLYTFFLNILLSSPSGTVSYSVVWGGIVPSPLARAQYLTRQHYRRTVPSGVDNNRILWSKKCKFREQIYLMNRVSTEALTTGRMIPSWTNI